MGRSCDWCGGPIASTSRRDTITCSKRCRQARHRFVAAVRGPARRVAPAGTRPLTFAYADPPYPGKARRYYRDHPDYAGEVDHGALIEQLVREYPDGWALSTSAEALPEVLGLCPPGVRVAAWVRGERPALSYRPQSSWEPVIYCGGRPVAAHRGQERRLDSLIYHARARTTDPHRVVGAKPAAFCGWLFDLLGAAPTDTVVDLYPGSGGVARAWRAVQREAAAAARDGSARHINLESTATRRVRPATRDMSRPPARTTERLAS